MQFDLKNFCRVIREIEIMEERDENIWVPIGILEYMYSDDCGYIDNYFRLEKVERDSEVLYRQLIYHLEKNNLI